MASCARSCFSFSFLPYTCVCVYVLAVIFLDKKIQIETISYQDFHAYQAGKFFMLEMN